MLWLSLTGGLWIKVLYCVWFIKKLSPLSPRCFPVTLQQPLQRKTSATSKGIWTWPYQHVSYQFCLYQSPVRCSEIEFSSNTLPRHGIRPHRLKIQFPSLSQAPLSTLPLFLTSCKSSSSVICQRDSSHLGENLYLPLFYIYHAIQMKDA